MSLQATGVYVAYGSTPALNGVDFSASAGSVTALLGPNGSGKTTLSRCLCGLVRATRGTIKLNGIDVGALSSIERARLISLVPQHEETVFDFSVFETVEMGLYPWSPLADAETRIHKALASMKLTALRQRKVSELSGGERQRVLLARALVQDTPIVVLDEPTAHMDVGFQIAALSHLREIAQSGKTVVVALHDLNLAAGFADHAALMLNGVVVVQGSVRSILESSEIERVYGAAFDRFRDEKHDRLILAPEFIPKTGRTKTPKRIHLIGGGGSAAALLTELWQLGHLVTLGIAHRGDSDVAAAERLGVPVQSVPAFSTIGDSELAACAEFAEDADELIYCSPPVSEGNLVNIEFALHMQRLGKKLTIVRQLEPDWDFTNGRATEFIAKANAGGAIEKSIDQIISDFSQE